MKISFDFDDCLSEKYIQVIASALIAANHEVWVITARDLSIYPNNQDILKLCDEIGIKRDHIIITNGNMKYQYYIDNNFDLHFDDDWKEVNLINVHGGNSILVNPDFENIYSSIQYKANENGKKENNNIRE